MNYTVEVKKKGNPASVLVRCPDCNTISISIPVNYTTVGIQVTCDHCGCIFRVKFFREASDDTK
jgi:transcription elongation factor Elf1